MFYAHVHTICSRYSARPEEAEEMLNDVFFKVFTHIERLPELSAFKPWLNRIAVNTCIDHYRVHHRNKPMIGAFEEAHGSLLPVEPFEEMFGADELLAMVQRLSPAYRTVFNLYAVDGYSHDEISQMLEISVGTSKSNLSKARENLRAMLHLNTAKTLAKHG